MVALRHGVDRYDRYRGQGIVVGVIDTGCGPHTALEHVTDHGSYILGVYSAEGRDSAQHGTHICGAIGARASRGLPGGYVGVAPGAAMHSIRVCPSGGRISNQIDIALALRHLSRVPVDLIAVGLTASDDSEILKDAVAFAAEAGALCICPAGNKNARLRYPAALDDAAAVTAIGCTLWGPDDALVQSHRPGHPRRGRIGSLDDFQVYLAAFSAVAPPAVTCAAPGVGIISCVPGGKDYCGTWAEMSGTSMAAALATAALAAILSKKENYLYLPHALERADLAHALLGMHCRTAGLDRDCEGRGIPFVGL
jgi:subtilisin family serine protease